MLTLGLLKKYAELKKIELHEMKVKFGFWFGIEIRNGIFLWFEITSPVIA